MKIVLLMMLYLILNANELDKVSSPYLLQHKDNPVAWNIWSKDIFLKAQKENKPIFLSIGYSTCH